MNWEDVVKINACFDCFRHRVSTVEQVGTELVYSYRKHVHGLNKREYLRLGKENSSRLIRRD